MALKVQPAYIGQTGYLHPVELDRNLLEGLMGRTGVLRYGDMRVTPTAGTRAVSIAAGRIHIVGQENAQQGSYFAWSDAADTFTFAAATVNPRIDSILVRIYDDQYGVISGSPRAEYVIVQGVASGSPVARPDSDFLVGGSQYIPGAWARIANVRVNVGDTTIPGGQITNIERYVRVAGITLCLSTDRPSDPVFGDRCWDIDTGIRRVYNSTSWVQSEAWIGLVQLGAGAATMSITGIPTTLRTLEATWEARTVLAAEPDAVLFRVNATATGYAYQNLIQQNATPSGSANFRGDIGFPVGFCAAANTGAGRTGGGVVRFIGWNAPSSLQLAVNWQGGVYGNTSATAYSETGNGTYIGAQPYTSLEFRTVSGSNFSIGSWVRVVGWE